MKVVTMVVCGGGEEYNFLFGCLDRHLSMGQVLVVDTCAPDQAREFIFPRGVRWVRRPHYGKGWKEFRLVDALNEAIELAESMNPDVIVQLDCDEYFDCDIYPALNAARSSVIEVKTIHHLNDREALLFEEEWHWRLWPANKGVRVAAQEYWQRQPHYNGNPQLHHLVVSPSGVPRHRYEKAYHHHLHYALGAKSNDLTTAISSIVGWPDAGVRIAHCSNWPILIQEWMDRGRPPSDKFVGESQARAAM